MSPGTNQSRRNSEATGSDTAATEASNRRRIRSGSSSNDADDGCQTPKLKGNSLRTTSVGLSSVSSESTAKS